MLVVTLSFENNIYITLVEVMGVHTPTFVACKNIGERRPWHEASYASYGVQTGWRI